MITKPRYLTYLQKMVHLLSTIQIFKITEIYKIEHNLSESWLKDLCSAVNDNYNILSEFDFRVTA